MFALDFSENHIRVLELVKKGRRFLLNGLGEKEFSSKDEIPGLLKELVTSTKPQPIISGEIALAIPEEESFTKIIQVPQKEPNELQLLLHEEVAKILPYAKEDVYWDWKTIETLPDGTDHIDVMIVAAAKTAVDGYLQIIRDAGFAPALVETEPNALLWGVASPFSQEAVEDPSVIVNIGDEKSTVVIVARGVVRFSTSLKMDAMTKSPEYLAVPWNTWIQSNKTSWSLTQKNLLILLEKLREDLEYYHSHLLESHQNNEKTVKKVIITGSWANFPEIIEFIAKKIAIPTAKVQPLIKVHPSYTIALGLALRGLYEEHYS